MARHLAPFSCRQTIADSVRRRSFGCVLPWGRHASTNGSKLIQCASVSIALSSFQEGQNARHHNQFKREQALIAYSTQPFTCCTSTSRAHAMSRFNVQSNKSLCSPAVISPRNAKAIIRYRRYFSYAAEYAAITAFEPQPETRARWNSQSYCLQASGCAVSPFKIWLSTWASL